MGSERMASRHCGLPDRSRMHVGTKIPAHLGADSGDIACPGRLSRPANERPPSLRFRFDQELRYALDLQCFAELSP